jgi:hypothetical protein
MTAPIQALQIGIQWSQRLQDHKPFINRKCGKLRSQLLTALLPVIDLEGSLVRLMKVDDYSYDLTRTQLLLTAAFFAPIFDSLSFPEMQKDLAKIIYTHNKFK